MKSRIKRLFSRRGQTKAHAAKPPATDEARVTNETIAARREEVLGSARKFIYPLQSSKHRVVRLSVGIFIVAVVGFFGFCLLELYKFQSTSPFIYGVTRVLPFPIAIVNKSFVSYDSYLFELRHYMHYYETQQNVDFNTKAGRQRFAVFKKSSLDQAVQNAYVEKLAREHHISVSSSDVDTAVALVRSQNRLGASEQVFQNVLSEFWGWSVDDFRRELRQELLAQKVVNKLDTDTHMRADHALAQLQHGADFAKLAKQASDDTSTKGNGGSYGTSIDKANSDIAPQVIDELFKLRPGQTSGIINTGYSLEIVKVLSVQGSQVRAAHIAFNFHSITTYTGPLKARDKPHLLIRL